MNNRYKYKISKRKLLSSLYITIMVTIIPISSLFRLVKNTLNGRDLILMTLLFIFGIIIFVWVLLDVSLVVLKKQTIADAALNTVINVGIACIGGICPPLGAVLGVSYLVFSFFNEKPTGYIETDYVKIHGSATPTDNTRVHNPYKR